MLRQLNSETVTFLRAWNILLNIENARSLFQMQVYVFIIGKAAKLLIMSEERMSAEY